MDRLPREARNFLALTADCHDPPDRGARERVQARLIAMALLPMPHAPSASASQLVGSAPSATAWFTSSKVLIASVVAVTLSGGFWTLATRPSEFVKRAGVAAPAAPQEPTRPATPTAPIEVAQLQTAEALPAKSAARDETPAEHDADMAQQRARAVRVTRGARPAAAAAEGSLAQETELLHRASERLAQRELKAALSLLEEHRTRYRQSQLAEERNGLLVLAHCLRSPSEAAREARSFIANAPGSLLAPRLVSACGL